MNRDLESAIMERFGDELRSQGARIEFIEVDALPTDKELSERKSLPKFLGKLGDRFVWFCKSVFGVVVVYVTLMLLPDAIQKHKLYFPKSYDVVVKIAQKISEDSYFDRAVDTLDDAGGTDRPEGLVFYKPDWISNSTYYEQDRSHFLSGDATSIVTSGTTTLPASGSTVIGVYNVVSYVSRGSTKVS